jgi:ribonuclease HI
MDLMLFTDGSVDIETKVGFGAMLVVSKNENYSVELIRKIKLKRFESTSSTRLELQTFLWALNTILPTKEKLLVYTDSQNILNLPARREKLEKNNYQSKNNRIIKNHDLYREFFRAIDRVNCEFVKVKGHKKSSVKIEVDRFFTLVDRASRNKLRDEVNKNELQ